MKKVTYCLIISIVLALFSNVVLAAENVSFGIGLTSTKTQVKPGDEITVTLKVKDLKNMEEGIYSFLATIDYDKEVFETLTESSVKGLGTWSSVPTFNPDNGLITADSGTGVKEESEVFAITFKVKSTAETGKGTQIIVKDFEASEGEEDIKANSEAKITINVSKDEEDNSGNTNTPDTPSQPDVKPETPGTSDNNTNNKDEGSANGKLPQTGENDFIIFSIGATLVLAIGGYIGYKKYSKI